MTRRQWPDSKDFAWPKDVQSFQDKMEYFLMWALPFRLIDEIAPKIEEPKKACAFVSPQGQVIFYLDGVGCFADYHESELWTRRSDLDIEGKL